MEIKNVCDILIENSINKTLNENTIIKQPEIIGNIITEGYSKSIVSDICNVIPLTKPTGYVFGVKSNEDGSIKLVKNMVEVKDHIKNTNITKETIDDIFSQYNKDGVKLITNLIKRDLFLEQDYNVIKYINKIAKKVPDLIVPNSGDMDGEVTKLMGFIDAVALEMAYDLKTNVKGFIIASPIVMGLLQKDDNVIPKNKEELLSYVGSVRQRDLFCDYNAEEEYIIVGLNPSKDLRGITFCPYNIEINYHDIYQDGSKMIRINNRYGFIRNPLDNEGDDNSRFFVKAKVKFSQEYADFNEFVEAFNSQITKNTDPE